MSKTIVGIFLMGLVLTGCDKEHKMSIGIASEILGGNQEVPNPQQYTHAYLLMGQSNMSRNCNHSMANFFSTYDRRDDAGCSTGQQIAEVFNDPDTLYIQCAYGGTEMARWVPGGDLYERCLSSVPSYLPVRGMFFFQGEADAINGLSVPDWSNAFQSMVQDLRIRFGSTLPVVLAQIGSGRNDPDWVAIQQEQASISLIRVRMVITSDLQPDDGVHFTQSGYRVIAERMVEALRTLN